MNVPYDFITILFALLAVFVAWRLRSILGSRTGHERPPAPSSDSSPYSPLSPRRRTATEESSRKLEELQSNRAEKTPERADWEKVAQPGSRVWSGLEEISSRDPSFDLSHFLEGAKAAYEMILQAFAAGDLAQLRKLLAQDVFEKFSQVIQARNQENLRLETILVTLEDLRVEEAKVLQNQAQITLRFLSQMIHVTRDSEGKIVDGSPDKIVTMNDCWAFGRKLNAGDGNWTLMATGVVI